MATGIKGRFGNNLVVRLLENLAAANTVADGMPGDVLKASPSSTQFFDLGILKQWWLDNTGEEFVWPESSTLKLYETAGSGTITLASARVMLYDSISGKHFPAGNGTDADKGKLNNAAAFGETGTDQLRHQEVFSYPGHCDGIGVNLGTFGGTTPTFNVDWHIPIRSR